MRHRGVPRAVDHRLPARGPRAQARLRRRQPAALDQARRPHRALRGDRRLRRRRTATCSTRPRSARRGGARHLPQAAPAELRRVRRGPLLHAGRPDRPAGAVRDRRRAASASASARTSGAPTGRSPSRPPAAPSSSSTSTPRRTTTGKARLPGADARHPRRRRRTPRSSTSTRSAARTSWSSTGARWCSTPTASSSPGPAVRRGPARRRRRRRRRLPPAPARPTRRGVAHAPLPEVAVSEAPARPDAAPAAPTAGRRSDPSSEVYEALVLGTRDY